MARWQQPTLTSRTEVFRLDAPEGKLKEVPNLTDNKHYKIVKERNHSKMFQMIYTVLNDNNEEQEVNSHYFIPPEPKLVNDDGSQDLVYLRKKGKPDYNILGYKSNPHNNLEEFDYEIVDVPDIRKMPIKSTENLFSRDLKVLSGLSIPIQDTLENMKKTLSKVLKDLNNATNIIQELSTEIEILKRTNRE